jgi:hypothetical protein
VRGGRSGEKEKEGEKRKGKDEEGRRGKVKEGRGRNGGRMP